MTSTIGLPMLVASAFFASATCTIAQTAGPDEAIQPNGAVSQQLALTTAQRSAIYNAVVGQRVRPAAAWIAAAVGAAVPPSVELDELPDQAAVGSPWETPLKYAMVEGDIVVVDPLSMRIVDVIRHSEK